MQKRNLLTLALLALVTLPTASAQAAKTLTINCFSNLDEAVAAAIPAYKKLHPEVTISSTS